MYVERDDGKRIERYAGPYERWIFSEELGRPYAFPAIKKEPSNIMAAILEGGGDPTKMAAAVVRVPPLWPKDEKQHAVVPFAFKDKAKDVDDGSLATCLASLPDGDFQPRVRLNIPIPKASWAAKYRPDDPPKAWTKPAVTPKAILGIIDDGIPFAHRAFLSGDGKTRVSHLWLQAGRAEAGAARVPYGREFQNAEIDEKRGEYGLDERLLYREVGAIDASLPEVGTLLDGFASHGAHVMGLAAGNAPNLAVPDIDDSVQIIAVQLPNTIAWDTSGFGKESFMLAALHYIFRRADEIAAACGLEAPLPLVLNFSYGWSGGRHDGKSDMEAAMEEMLQRRKTVQAKSAIVLPTGNDFSSKMHARMTAADMADGTARMAWRVHPDDRTSSYLEIWLPEGFDPKGWSVRVVPPKGAPPLTAGGTIPISANTALKPIGDPRRFVEMELDGKNLGQLSVDLNRGTRWRVMIAVIPTAETDTGRRLPAGRWTVEVRQGKGAALAEDQALEFWVQRDNDPADLDTGGQQSWLEPIPSVNSSAGLGAGEGFEAPGGPVRGYGAVSAIASAPSTTRVAGVIGSTVTVPAKYSGAGGVRDLVGGFAASGAQPDLSALADVSRGIHGTRSIGCVTGSSSWLTGTSASAALASRWMVANAAAGRALDDGLVKVPKLPAGVNKTLRAARLGKKLVPLT